MKLPTKSETKLHSFIKQSLQDVQTNAALQPVYATAQCNAENT
jgi:hypothetical protein